MNTSSSGNTTTGISTPATSVRPHSVISQPGMIRTSPSAKPRYQSGWAPVDTWSAR